MAENENGQEKTEQPSPKRREEAIEKGNVAKSSELNSVAVLIATLIVFRYLGGFIGEELNEFMNYIYTESSMMQLNETSFAALSQFTITAMFTIMAPVLLIVLLFAVASNVGQVGFIVATKALKPNFKKLNPFSGLKRLFSMRSIVELVKGLLKIAIIGIIGYLVVMSHYEEYLVLPHQSVMHIAGFMGDVMYDLTFKIAIALLVMAIGDFAYQKYDHEKNLKMTKQEVKEENKQAEGDPQVKGRIRTLQREMARRRMMADIPEATVVVTNPTHYAVALKYDPAAKADAPKVIAKGKNLIAQKIKEIAAEHGVPVVENKPLARSLFSATEVGDEIPGALYQAVAEVLSQVFQADRNRYDSIRRKLNG